MAATLHEAEAECAAHGRRLCTASEYASSCCRSGCQMDLMAAWVQGGHGCVTPTRPAPNICPFACAAETGGGGAASSSASGGERGAKQIAVCAVGQVRGFTLPFVYRSSYQTFLAPVRDMADVFFAIDARSAGTEGVGTFDEYPNRTAALPAELLRLFAPVAIEWGHAERRCCTASCEGHNCVSRAAMRRTPPDARCAGHAPISFGQTFSMWRAWQLITHYEQAGRRGAAYSWVVRFRPDSLLDRPLPPYATWPSIDRPVLYTEGGERLALSSRRCCGRECFRMDDHFFVATRAAARVYMQTVYERYFTWPACSEKVPAHPGCDTSGPAGSLRPEKISPIMASHNVSLCKAGQARAMVRVGNSTGEAAAHTSSPWGQSYGALWLASPSNHKPALSLRPLAHAHRRAGCPQAATVCSLDIGGHRYT